MRLFGKKKEEKNCRCAGECGEKSIVEKKVIKEIKTISVLGSGCKNCHALYENAKEAADKLNLGIEVEYITDLQQIMKHGVMSMPALLINGVAVSCGRVLKTGEIEKLLTE